MDIRELSALERTPIWLDEVIEVCRKMGSVYTKNPKMAADVTRKAKSLRTALKTLRAFLDQPKGGKTQ